MTNLRDEIYSMLGEYLFPSASRDLLTDMIYNFVSRKIEEQKPSKDEEEAHTEYIYQKGYDKGYYTADGYNQK